MGRNQHCVKCFLFFPSCFCWLVAVAVVVDVDVVFGAVVLFSFADVVVIVVVCVRLWIIRVAVGENAEAQSFGALSRSQRIAWWRRR